MFFQKAGAYFYDDEVTFEQPFASGTLGCEQFRIPGLIKLNNGSLLAVSDARWTDANSDYGGIDTIYSLSHDNGKTWHPGYAAMFPDSEGSPTDPTAATTCIDPCVVQAPDGKIHIFVNMNPSGITTGLKWPQTGTGFIEVHGRKRLAVFRDYTDTDTSPDILAREKLCYVGDFIEGFADIVKMNGASTGYVVDEYFNIFSREADAVKPLYQSQINTNHAVQQNLFYKDSILHVYNTMYTLHLVSEDQCCTWRAEIISDKIKHEDETALISSPGNGTVTSDGVILMPFYYMTSDFHSASCIVYSEDNGDTWKRTAGIPKNEEFPWSGECKAVEIRNDLWRLFFRNDKKHICYADFDRTSGLWKMPVSIPVKVHSDCNFSAIRMNDKILVSYPAGIGPDASGRLNGKLYVFRLDENGDMLLENEIPIEENAFSYSCIAVLDEKNIGILFDTCGDGKVIFRKRDLY